VVNSYFASNRRLTGSGTGAWLKYEDVDSGFLDLLGTTLSKQSVTLERDQDESELCTSARTGSSQGWDWAIREAHRVKSTYKGMLRRLSLWPKMANSETIHADEKRPTTLPLGGTTSRLQGGAM
jgi:hypothetical protein